MKLILSVLLFICLAKMPYSYFMIMRVIACIIFIFLAIDKENEENGIYIILLILVVVFQPIWKANFNRQTWNIIDVIVAIGLIIWVANDIRSKSKIPTLK